MKKNSNRITRINEEIKHEISNIIGNGLKDPRVDSLTSIVRVDTTTDLKHCKVFFSTLGDEEKQQQTLAGLNNSAGYIRHELARSVNLRNTPELKFIMDCSIEYGVKMSQMIDQVNQKESTTEEDEA